MEQRFESATFLFNATFLLEGDGSWLFLNS